METDRAASAKAALTIHSEFNDVFTGLGHFNLIFSLKVKDDSKLYKAPPGCIAYATKRAI